MDCPHLNPARALFVRVYATKLKGLKDTPYRWRPIRELEQMAERCLEAVEKSLAGDNSWLERYISHIVLKLSRKGFLSWHLIKGFEVFHDTSRRLPHVFPDLNRVNDALYWAIVRFAQLYEELQSVQGLARMVESLTMALDSKEEYTSNHSHAVQKIAAEIAKVLGIDVSLAALLHDVGKIHVPDRILTKQGPLDRDEWAILRQHPYHSFRIVYPIHPEAAAVCLRHHERPDGRGYPLGETDVRIEANTIAAADTLHAICSKRSYHSCEGLDVALSTIRGNVGTQFLPEVVHALDRAYGDVAGLLSTFEPPRQTGDANHGSRSPRGSATTAPAASLRKATAPSPSAG